MIESNPLILASTRLVIPKLSPSNQVFSGSLNVILGCVQSTKVDELFCSSLEFSSLAVINQFFLNLQHLSLLPSDHDQFADYHIMRKNENKFVAASDSHGKFGKIKLKKVKIMSKEGSNSTGQENAYEFSWPGSAHFLEIDLEFRFKKWFTENQLKTNFGRLQFDHKVQLLQISNNNNSMISLSIVNTSPFTNTQQSLADSTKNTFFLELSVDNKIIELDKKIQIIPKAYSKTPINSTRSSFLNPIAKNMKISIYIQNTPSKGLAVHLFHTDSSSISGEHLTSEYAFVSKPDYSGSFKNTLVSILSPSVNKLQDFKLARVLISDSLGAQALQFLKTPNSSTASACFSNCLLGGRYISQKKFEETMKSQGMEDPVDPQICWMCGGDSVYHPFTQKCQAFCDESMKNVFGNCVFCETSDCFDNAEALKFKAEFGDDYNVIRLIPSVPILSSSDQFYEKNFEIFEKQGNQNWKPKLFKTKAIEGSQDGMFILKKQELGK